MEAIGGDLAGHDHEFDEVRWISFETAASMLTFETERALVARAGEILGETRSPADQAPAGPAPAETAT